MVVLTNKKLRTNFHRPTTSGEIIKFFGTLVLMTRCKFSNRRDLWSTCTLSRVLGQPKFGSIMSRERFEIIRKFLQFSQDKTDHCYTEKTQWSLCEEFVEAINAHRREHVIPSHFLCVDESMSRWYGLGGSWIDVGCPHYVKLERKPENGTEIQNVACAKSWIMLGLKLVKYAKESDTVREMSTGTMELESYWNFANHGLIGRELFALIVTLPQLRLLKFYSRTTYDLLGW